MLGHDAKVGRQRQARRIHPVRPHQPRIGPGQIPALPAQNNIHPAAAQQGDGIFVDGFGDKDLWHRAHGYRTRRAMQSVKRGPIAPFRLNPPPCPAYVLIKQFQRFRHAHHIARPRL